ncbi:predicted protein [Paecilomyces variotii No. 5]|uniref:Xylanolytic transcriptional activator regulatory domain-containing protein n=1 Tax=Byssochlamys spectabilis (strain No. 5 / NBRC 109023) TaxID=1356009 RepID=V5FIZ4_BYSSN|nr:predicted protein [Paecilomyces variotii No. 5]
MTVPTLLDRLEKLCNVDIDDASIEVIKSLPFKLHNQTSNQYIITEELLNPSNRDILTELVAKYGHQGWETVYDRAGVQICARNLPFITGCVLLQVSPRFINDCTAIIRHCERLAEYFQEHNVPLDRFAIKIPFSGPAAAAAAKLNTRGIRTLATAVFSVEQAIAASQSNCLFISPYFNEIAAHLDPSLRPEVTDVALEHPMSTTVLQILQTFAKNYKRTRKEQPIMVIASHFNTAEILAMAELGCQHVTVMEPNLRALQETPDTLPPVEKPKPAHPYATFVIPERLRALLSKNTLGETTSDDQYALLQTDYLANRGEELDKFMQRNTVVRRKFDDAMPSQRIEVLENLLHQHAASIEELKRQLSIFSSPGLLGIAGHLSVPLSQCPSQSLNSSASLETTSNAVRSDSQSRSPIRQNDDASAPITIPIGHQTSTGDLLMLPQISRLTGCYPDGFFSKVEEQRQRSPLKYSISPFENESSQLDFHVDKATCDSYLESFFDVVHPFHPFLDTEELLDRYEDTMAREFHFNSQSALILAVLGLGATASDPVDLDNADKPYSGDGFIRQALGFLLPAWSTSFQGDVVITQALILCAIYFTYTTDPMMAWRLVHMASTSIQQKVLYCFPETFSQDPQVQSLIRLGWVCYIIECDVLAEFHLPRSGIELLADKMPLPDYNGPPCPRNLYVLADITARSLLNRMHNALFAIDSQLVCTPGPLEASSNQCFPTLGPEAPLFRICQELDRQLETWYESLPTAIRPDLHGRYKGSNQACLLRLRYWSAKQQIHRAFVLYVTSAGTRDSCDFPPSILDKCGVCLDACHAFLLTAGHILSCRTPYTYSVAQCCLGSALILSAATQNPILNGSYPKRIYPILKRTADDIRPWAQGDSSLKNVYEMASLLAAKLRFES